MGKASRTIEIASFAPRHISQAGPFHRRGARRRFLKSIAIPHTSITAYRREPHIRRNLFEIKC